MPAVTLTFDHLNLIWLLVVVNEHSLEASSRLLQPFRRYCGQKKRMIVADGQKT